MEDLLFCLHVVVNTLNYTWSFGRLRQGIVLKCVPHVQHDYFSSVNQSDHCFLASSLPFPPSFPKLPKGLAKLGNIVAKTFLRMQMFPNLAAR